MCGLLEPLGGKSMLRLRVPVRIRANPSVQLGMPGTPLGPLTSFRSALPSFFGPDATNNSGTKGPPRSLHEYGKNLGNKWIAAQGPQGLRESPEPASRRQTGARAQARREKPVFVPQRVVRKLPPTPHGARPRR